MTPLVEAGLAPARTTFENGVVLLAKYWKEGRPGSVREKDETARRIFAEAFPDRKIVQIDAENINLGGGGMHCVTQQQPAEGAE